MVAQLEQQHLEVTREHVTAYVEGYIASGKQPNDAYREVFNDLDHLGQLGDLARLMGPSLIGIIWREFNASRRPGRGGAIFRQPSTDSGAQTVAADSIQTDGVVTQAPPVYLLPAAPRDPIAPPPDPVIPIPVVMQESRLYAQEKIGGIWVVVKDLTKVQCMALYRAYKESSKPLIHRSRYYLAMSEAIGEDETVGQKFDDEKLERLHRITKP